MESLNHVQTQVAAGLPLLKDKAAFVQEIMERQCQPWFTLDAAHALNDQIGVFRTDVAAPASLLLSVLQPHQSHSPRVPFHVMVYMRYKKDGGRADGFGLELSCSDTVARLKVEIERRSGVARDRLMLMGYFQGGFHKGGLPDDVELGTLISGFGECKVHAFVDYPEQIIPI